MKRNLMDGWIGDDSFAHDKQTGKRVISTDAVNTYMLTDHHQMTDEKREMSVIRSELMCRKMLRLILILTIIYNVWSCEYIERTCQERSEKS